MDFRLTPEHVQFRETFEALCQEKIAPRAREVDERARVPLESWRDLANAGYFQLFHPPEVGGWGADGTTLGIALETLGRACASTLWTTAISNCLCGKFIWNLCGPRHREHWLKDIACGNAIACLAITERGAGSDPASCLTSVRKSAPGYVLNGEKHRVSNATIADLAITVATTDTGELAYVLVDLSSSGVRRATQKSMGLRGAGWGSLFFDDVAIDREDVITDANMSRLLQSVEWGQLFQAFCSIGLAEAAFSHSREYALERCAFGRPIAHMEVIYRRIAQMRVSIDAARLLAREAAWTMGQHRSAGDKVLMAKIQATEMAVQVADDAMRIFAGWGYTTDFPIERIYRDSLGNVPAGLTTDRLREFVSCPMVGADPWRYEPFDELLIDAGHPPEGQ